jgi:NAD(P)-dependent dehydrogenase (short-subunit alcohol dehydrogenase family)
MIAKTLYAAGARIIYLLGNNQDELDEAEMITDTDKDPIFRVFNCDITSENSLVAAARQVQDDVGHVELFIANAGASFVEPGPLSMSPTDFTRHFFQTGRSQDRYNDTLKVNVGGTFYSIAAFLPLLEASAVLRAGQSAERKNPKPHILITSSAGAFSRDSITTLPAYGASKAAVMHMMKSLSTYSLKNDWKIRVNALVPGMIRTPLTASLPFMQGQNGKTAEEEGGVHKSICPHERVVREEELAGAVLWVCGRAGEAVDGAAVLVEGGKLSVVPGTY